MAKRSISDRITKFFREKVIFSGAAVFIVVLVFCHGLVEEGLIRVLFRHLQDLWEHEHIQKAAVIMNAFEGLSAVLGALAAFLSDAYCRVFYIILSTSLIYTIGMILLWLAALISAAKFELFYVAIFVMLPVGLAGRDVPLKAFLADQLRAAKEPNANEEEEEEEEERKKKERIIVTNTNYWWILTWLPGAFVGSFWLVNLKKWTEVSLVSAISMVVGYVFFLSGTKFFYLRDPSTGSSIGVVLLVLRAAILKRHLNYPQHSTDQFYCNDLRELEISPRGPYMRWLDKAAIVEQDHQETQAKYCCTVKQVREVKLLLTMIPMWSTFLVYSLVTANQRTFFLEQAYTMDRLIDIGNISNVPVVTFFLIKALVHGMVVYLMKRFAKLWKGDDRKVNFVRIGCGMLCAALCCISACAVEVRRLHLVKTGKFIVIIDGDGKEQFVVKASVFLLTPQFILLGLMSGLAEKGLKNFYEARVSESMRNYGPAFNKFVVAIGKFLSSLIILTARSWFKNTLNESRLDMYLLVLAIVCFLNLLWYCRTAYGYHTYEQLPGEEDDSDLAKTKLQPEKSRSLPTSRAGESSMRSYSFRNRVRSLPMTKSSV